MTLRAILMMIVCAVPIFGSGTVHDESSAKITKGRSFYVAGYSVRTNNADEAAGRGRIGDLWRRFREQNLGATIPNREPDALIVVYSNYESDENGEYDYLLGARVSSIRNLPAGMVYREVSAGRYAVFTTSPGPVMEVVPKEWKRIWKTSPKEMGGRRAFITDYEVYDRRSADPSRAQVEIHIGVNVGHP